ncbi:uncharacterized protein LOC100179625 [Ciona intestinalis]|uniref:Uncharacterized LOC100179625 n=1 Tax=Ciona intestinalis TaxID=7719 RepID=F6REZ6_CIOIN|nr:uncharacterized protein LOC100179625 [Ciona intestinalis]|eukprot:XP_002131471.1 uncharacterized protein LOC100179625 [Ciona intestinalis]
MSATFISGARTSSKWGKHDPVSMQQSRTDHWSKMKHQATNFTLKMPEATVITKQLPHDASRYRMNPDGSIIPLKGEAFDDKLNRDFQDDTAPGNYQKTRLYRSRSIPNMKKYRNQFNDRAREGFKFWPLTRPKPTLYGKYGMGSYKSVLGLGDAVRT